MKKRRADINRNWSIPKRYKWQVIAKNVFFAHACKLVTTKEGN